MATPEQSAEAVFEAALDLPPGQRSAYLAKAFRDAPQLRDTVVRLFSDYHRLGDFLDDPAFSPDPATTLSDTGPVAHVLVAGDKLGRYVIVEPLGAGGMGAVYRARDEKLERIIAIKILPPGMLTGDESRRRFRKEALALAKLSHPNIAPVYDVGEQDGIDYIVMECVAGQTLATRLRAGPLSVKEATSILLQVAQALEEAHEQGVIHRDLKPANVMITPRGHVKVLDFGIAKLLAPTASESIASITEAGFIVGTPLYMSPEQAQGKDVDARSDLWSLGVIYYECLTGSTPFQAESSIAIFHGIVMKDPAPLSECRPDAPPLANAIVLQSLAKDPAARYQSASETIRDASALVASLSITPPTDLVPAVSVPQAVAPKALYYFAAIAALLVVIAGAFFIRRRPPANTVADAQWEQLTFFTDSAVYPALSPDGRMLAFIRGSDSFFGPGQVYVKMLPGGEPVELTHEPVSKLSPTFSPDGSTIAYGIVEDYWATREVPVLGGDSHVLMPNSTSLTWIEGGKRLLFSEVQEGTGLHLVVVSTDQGRGDSRDVYDPPGKRSMAHHAYLSPDGRWVLIVEMDNQGKILPCRVVPFPVPGVLATSDAKPVGPPDRSCLAGAWSPDSKWIYLSVKTDVRAVGRVSWQLGSSSHIWRQRFPDGQPEQLTFGPTSQEGIAVAPDGKSIVTSVGSQDSTVWMHDKEGDHQISSEGNASSPSFSSDGKSLYFLMANGQTQGEELWMKDLAAAKAERVLPGYPMRDYSVSRDGKQVAFTRNDQSGPSNLWVAPTSRRATPRRISSAAAEDSPFFLPDGDLVFRAIEGGSNFLYRMKADGSARQKISQQRIWDVYDVSPDGRWVAAAMPGSGDEEQVMLGETKAFAVDGSAAVTMCLGDCELTWDTRGGFVYLRFPERKDGASYALPVTRESGLPSIPSATMRVENIRSRKGIVAIPWPVGSAATPSVYAYTRLNTRRNLYRIPLP
jgi:Tol biopolymer transport system component/predicted Ser/Thr protein kinase